MSRTTIRGGGIRTASTVRDDQRTFISRAGRIETTGFERLRGDALVNPRAVVEVGQATPGAVVVPPIAAAGVMLYAAEMAAFEKARSAQYLASDEWLAWSEANGNGVDAKAESRLLLRRDSAVADAVAAGIRLIERADEKAFDAPEQKRFRRMTKSH